MSKQKLAKLIVLIGCILFAAVRATLHGPGDIIAPATTKGMVIDAGSGGSRLHVYTWKPRRFSSVPPPLSYPEGNEKWTARMSPGISTFAHDLDKIALHLAPLIAFAKTTLAGYEAEFSQFPIYFYATGGMRQLDSKQREKVVDMVRKFLSDETKCPFFFKNDYARVISGK